MTQQTIIYGYIQGAEWMSSDLRKLHRLNREVIHAMPVKDKFPYLTQGMFAIPGDEPEQGTFRSQIIHFGGSMKEVEVQWRQWLEKFEALLRKLYWFSGRFTSGPKSSAITTTSGPSKHIRSSTI